MSLSQDFLFLVSKLAASLQPVSPLSPPPQHLVFLQSVIILTLSSARSVLPKETKGDHYMSDHVEHFGKSLPVPALRMLHACMDMVTWSKDQVDRIAGWPWSRIYLRTQGIPSSKQDAVIGLCSACRRRVLADCDSCTVPRVTYSRWPESDVGTNWERSY